MTCRDLGRASSLVVTASIVSLTHSGMGTGPSLVMETHLMSVPAWSSESSVTERAREMVRDQQPNTSFVRQFLVSTQITMERGDIFGTRGSEAVNMFLSSCMTEMWGLWTGTLFLIDSLWLGRPRIPRISSG